MVLAHIFQQDKALIHGARIIKKYFRRHNVDVIEHPPYSPNLNPIKHTWVELKRRLPHLGDTSCDTSGGPPKVREKLGVILPEILEDPFISLRKAGSKHARVAAVIDAKDWYRYQILIPPPMYCLSIHLSTLQLYPRHYIDASRHSPSNIIIFCYLVVELCPLALRGTQGRRCVETQFRVFRQDFCVVTATYLHVYICIYFLF